mgnify:CR=1 FL=1
MSGKLWNRKASREEVVKRLVAEARLAQAFPPSLTDALGVTIQGLARIA